MDFYSERIHLYKDQHAPTKVIRRVMMIKKLSQCNKLTGRRRAVSLNSPKSSNYRHFYANYMDENSEIHLSLCCGATNLLRGAEAAV
jgi:hypothetical protein